MAALFLLLFLASPTLLIFGLIKPSIFSNWFKGKTPSRENLIIIFSLSTGIFFLLTIITASNKATTKKNDISNQKLIKKDELNPTKTSAIQINEIGQEAFLRLQNNTSIKQLIPLAPTKEVSTKTIKALIAKDWYGLQELMLNEGVFGVQNGTKALIIDVSFESRQVRILQGEMLGKSGWLPKEYVVDR